MAEIELPENIQDDKVLKNYSEEVKNNNLEIIKSSNVTLHIEATSKLSEAELIDTTGLSIKKELNEVNTFTHTFQSRHRRLFRVSSYR